MTRTTNFRARVSQSYRHFKIGLIATICLAVLVSAALLIPRAGIGTETIRAEFAQAAGVRSGDAVRVAGVPVGSVDGVKLRGDHVDVMLRIDNPVPLGATTTASIRLATILGTRYISLEPRGTGELRDNVIEQKHTSVPFDLAALIDTGTPKLAAIDEDKLRQSLDTLDSQFERTPALLPQALDQIGRLSDVVNSRNNQVTELVKRSANVAALFQRNTHSLQQLVTTGTDVANTVIRQRQLITSVLADIRAVTRQMTGVVTDNADDIGRLLKQLDRLSAGLNRSDRDIGNTLEAIPVFARHLGTATGNGPYMDGFLGASIVSDNLLCLLGLVGGCR
ncbi:Mce family protein [Gordonia effusa NBRC 100432]|uniref:Mce family protein n=1 Tax=Gordonia effusa NBRC 100432 TaxID=1077974 RepID=H0R662_9ACTN|nr:MCE family protein [Gordonia effusa]GAB20563.1 Mce family protein [Gordonia effusa NBRC 100432]